VCCVGIFHLRRSDSRSAENAFAVRIADRGPPFEYPWSIAWLLRLFCTSDTDGDIVTNYFRRKSKRYGLLSFLKSAQETILPQRVKKGFWTCVSWTAACIVNFVSCRTENKANTVGRSNMTLRSAELLCLSIGPASLCSICSLRIAMCLKTGLWRIC